MRIQIVTVTAIGIGIRVDFIFYFYALFSYAGLRILHNCTVSYNFQICIEIYA